MSDAIIPTMKISKQPREQLFVGLLPQTNTGTETITKTTKWAVNT